MTGNLRAWAAGTLGLVLLAGCAVRIAYHPDENLLEALSRDQREQMFAEALSRVVKPRIVQVWIDDSAYGYDGARTLRDPYGIPVGAYGQRRIVYFANVGDLWLHDNNAVFVVDTSGRVVDKLVFASRSDAAQVIDLIASYRARRYRATASPEDGDRPRTRRYDRRYDERRPDGS